jgi:hypothetical protein
MIAAPTSPNNSVSYPSHQTHAVIPQTIPQAIPQSLPHSTVLGVRDWDSALVVVRGPEDGSFVGVDPKTRGLAQKLMDSSNDSNDSNNSDVNVDSDSLNHSASPDSANSGSKSSTASSTSPPLARLPVFSFADGRTTLSCSGFVCHNMNNDRGGCAGGFATGQSDGGGFTNRHGGGGSADRWNLNIPGGVADPALILAPWSVFRKFVRGNKRRVGRTLSLLIYLTIAVFVFFVFELHSKIV